MQASISSENSQYIENLFLDYKKDPSKLTAEWRAFFSGVLFSQTLSGFSKSEIDVLNLIQAYRDYGYLVADLDPLKSKSQSIHVLDLSHFNLNENNLNEVYHMGALIGLEGKKLSEIIEQLKRWYCGTLTVEIANTRPEVRNWFINEMESKNPFFILKTEDKKEIFKSLMKTELLERFIQTRWVGAKRFSIEGSDSLLPMLEFLVSRGVLLGIEELVIGMAHRGRVNVLANFMEKALSIIFSEFDGHKGRKIYELDGDVKYHLGYYAVKKTSYDKESTTECAISLAFNPSHLEAVNPVVCGMTRARQRWRKDTGERKKVLPLLIHGDAAFAGQGVVSETLQLSQLPGYTVGGTLHIIIDNQIGFTAEASETRSTPFASDISKSLLSPVIHVNGDDPEACVQAVDLALRFRHQFKEDVVINLLSYRRHGHNEADEPSFTQPLMYEKIQQLPSVKEIYLKKLISEKVTTEEETQKLSQTHMEYLQKCLDEARKKPLEYEPLVFDAYWKGLRLGLREDFEMSVDTRVSKTQLKAVGEKINFIPDGFSLHPKLTKLVEARREMVNVTERIDWGMAELLSFGSLISEGTSVRLSGQDCVRGTFSHRHCIFTDIKNGQKFKPLGELRPGQVEFCVYNSPLSEMAVLGFEYGNAITDPLFLIIWEAQFGDFANGAQIIIDQFISSGESKWFRMNGLVLLLPHGYEGQGPEHSSARLERFLQLCAQTNMQVCNLTTPAQYFHVLRRQMKRDFRKPLIIMSPKSLLRHKKVISTLEELSQGSFEEYLVDSHVDVNRVERLIFCSGKFYYDLEEISHQFQNSALIRIEQIYPFLERKLLLLIKKFPQAHTWIWAQEEPKNMGAFTFIEPRLRELATLMSRPIELRWVSRTERASPATGGALIHQEEQQKLIHEAFNASSSKERVQMR